MSERVQCSYLDTYHTLHPSLSHHKLFYSVQSSFEVNQLQIQKLMSLIDYNHKRDMGWLLALVQAHSVFWSIQPSIQDVYDWITFKKTQSMDKIARTIIISVLNEATPRFYQKECRADWHKWYCPIPAVFWITGECGWLTYKWYFLKSDSFWMWVQSWSQSTTS